MADKPSLTKHRRWFASIALFALLFILHGCAAKAPEVLAPEQITKPAPKEPPLHLLKSLERPMLQPLDDATVSTLVAALSAERQGLGSWKDMTFAVTQSLNHTSSKPPTETAVKVHGKSISYGEMTKALTTLLELLPELDANPEKLVSAFSWYRVGPDFTFTGYYEPTILASYKKTARFTHPLYALPKSKYLRTRTRHQIDALHTLRGKGLELAWIEDPMDGFVLQVQGSGRLVFEDGSERAILYAGQNGYKYRSIGRYMAERGYLPKHGVSMTAIRKWLKANPKRQRSVLAYNQSYIFFRLGAKGHVGSFGSMGRVITPRVSAAVDQTVLANGLLTFMSVPLPDDNGFPRRPFHALILPQDSGGAIKQHKVDLFFGSGEEAKHTASHINTKGVVVLLLPRKDTAHAKSL